MAPELRGIVVMGPSGNGKSTLARLLAERLGWRFIEGDAHHPPDNLAKMARGEPLDDADRAPFLNSVGRSLAAGKGVAACSALKRDYRDRLRRAAGGRLLFVLAQVPEAELARRMQDRPGHFMPPSLLASQLAVLEVPETDECAVLVDGMADCETQVTKVLAHIAAG